jgi:PAS domain S-box-containing protein
LLFYIAGWVIAGFFMEMQILNQILILYASRVSLAFASMLGTSLLIFSISFPDEKIKLPLFYHIGLRSIGLLSAILALSGFYIKGFKIVKGIAYRELTPFIWIFAILFIACLICSVYFFLSKYNKFSATQKNKTLYIITGLVVGFTIGAIFSLAFPLLGQDQLFPLGYFGPLFFALIAIYALFKRRLMDITLAIKKTTAYSLVTSAITFTYVLVVIGFEFLFRHFRGYYSFWASVPAALVIAITFVPVRDQLQRITDRIFFQQTIEYQKVMREVTKLIVSVTDLHTLFRLIDRTIIRVMCIRSAAVLLLEEKDGHYVVEKTNGLPQVINGIRLTLDDPLVSYLKGKKDAVVLEEVKALLQSDLTTPEEKENLKKVQAELERFGAVVAIPSFLREELVGILCLGEKLSGELYSPDDLELLLTMAGEAGIAIENAKLYRDITETRDYLDSLIRHSDDAILTFNMEGRVLTWNEGASKIFGCEASEVIGKLPPFFEEEEIKGFIAGVVRGVETKAVEVSKKDKKGNLVPLLLTFSPIKDPDGKLIGISGIIKDITELKKVEQLKREFLSIVSHELRTPLTPIKGYLDLLLNSHLGELNEKQRDALKIILNQSNHLNDLIDTVIDVSRIEAGKPLELEKEPLFIDEVLKSELEAVAHGFSTKGIKLQAHYPEERYSVLADRKKLIRVISNLLGNTLKFTPSGGEVGISILKTDNQLKITISDTGIGLAPQLLEKVFEKFFQVDSSYTRAAGGIGMGLAIAREIVEAHGGKIWAESKGLGEGSRFIFTLPLA